MTAWSCFIATGRLLPTALPRAVRWLCSIAATNIPDVWPTWLMSWIYPNSMYSPGMPAATASLQVHAATAQVSPPACATCRRSLLYRNQPRGKAVPGRLIDRHYLDSIGWRGIRQRKQHLEELLQQAISRLRDAGTAVHIVDIAAGHGRYILDALKDVEPLPESILLRDYSDLNVRDGNKLIGEKGLDMIARFIKADAFDQPGLAALDPEPTLAVVSGLYELFGDNRLVERSLAGLAEAMPRGGYLLYTNQPWHPQLELIARVLTSHRDGQPWIMRRRSQAEMDQLVEAAGFRKLTQRIDEWGIFSVSLAQKIA